MNSFALFTQEGYCVTLNASGRLMLKKSCYWDSGYPFVVERVNIYNNRLHDASFALRFLDSDPWADRKCLIGAFAVDQTTPFPQLLTDSGKECQSFGDTALATSPPPQPSLYSSPSFSFKSNSGDRSIYFTGYIKDPKTGKSAFWRYCLALDTNTPPEVNSVGYVTPEPCNSKQRLRFKFVEAPYKNFAGATSVFQLKHAMYKDRTFPYCAQVNTSKEGSFLSLGPCMDPYGVAYSKQHFQYRAVSSASGAGERLNYETKFLDVVMGDKNKPVLARAPSSPTTESLAQYVNGTLSFSTDGKNIGCLSDMNREGTLGIDLGFKPCNASDPAQQWILEPTIGFYRVDRT